MLLLLQSLDRHRTQHLPRLCRAVHSCWQVNPSCVHSSVASSIRAVLLMNTPGTRTLHNNAAAVMPACCCIHPKSTCALSETLLLRRQHRRRRDCAPPIRPRPQQRYAALPAAAAAAAAGGMPPAVCRRRRGVRQRKAPRDAAARVRRKGGQRTAGGARQEALLRRERERGDGPLPHLVAQHLLPGGAGFKTLGQFSRAAQKYPARCSDMSASAVMGPCPTSQRSTSCKWDTGFKDA